MHNARRLRRAMRSIASSRDGTNGARKVGRITDTNDMVGEAFLEDYIARYGDEKRQPETQIAYNYFPPESPWSQTARNEAKRKRRARR